MFTRVERLVNYLLAYPIPTGERTTKACDFLIDIYVVYGRIVL